MPLALLYRNNIYIYIAAMIYYVFYVSAFLFVHSQAFVPSLKKRDTAWIFERSANEDISLRHSSYIC